MPEEFEEIIEPIEDELLDMLERQAYAGQTIDQRHTYIADRQWRLTDAYLNGTIGKALFNREVLRNLPSFLERSES